MPNEISDASNAAIARAVPALSVSTTVRTPAGATTAGFPPVGMAGFIPPTAGPLPLGAAPIGPGGFAGALMAAGLAAPA